jgi:hypothetical protein
VTQAHSTIPTLEGAQSKLCLGGDFDFDRIARDVARSEIEFSRLLSGRAFATVAVTRENPAQAELGRGTRESR